MTILNTPIMDIVYAFDPSYQYTFTFSYEGNQIIRNRALIIDNSDYSIVYDKTQDGLRMSHVLASGILQPGHTYLIQIQVFDADNHYSNLSDQVRFQCLTTPEFYFHNIYDDAIIQAADFKAKLSYSQPEGEKLQELKFYLYQYDKTLLTASPSYYSSDTLEYEVYGLKNNSAYYMRAIGNTVNGMSLDTGYIKLNIVYLTIPADVIFQLENNYENGYISVYTGIKSIGYSLGNDHYSLSNGELTLDHNYITYNEGFTVDGDFIILLKARLLPLSTFLSVTSDNVLCKLDMVEIDQKFYCKLSVIDRVDSFVQYKQLPGAALTDNHLNTIVDQKSNMISIIDLEYNSENIAVFEVKRKDGVYNLSLYYEED